MLPEVLQLPAMTRSLAALALALLIFFGVGVANLNLPGLQYDEAADAVPALEMLAGKTPSTLSHFTFAGRELPLMMLHHIGPASVLTSLAGFLAMGVSVGALRISQLVAGALALVLLWLMARAWFNTRVAGVAVLLCGTFPPFIWWSRAGANFTVPLLPLALALMLVIPLPTGEARGGSLRIRLIFAAFLLGVGITTKILFVWMLIPLCLTWLIKRSDRSERSDLYRALLLALPALLLGLAPLIAHNIPNLDTLKFILGNAAQTSAYGHNNLDFANNLRVAISQFLQMMGGDTLHFGAPAGVPLGAAALVFALVYESVWLWRNRRAQPAGYAARAFLVFSIIGILPASTITTSSVGATYVFILVPFAWLLIAVACVDVFSPPAGRGRRWAWLMPIIAVALTANHLLINAATLNALEKTGGRGNWSDSIYTLNEALQTDYAGRNIIAMDWGFARNLQFLSNLKLSPQEVYEPAPRPSPKTASMSAVLLRNPQNVYLFHPPAQTFFNGVWDVFNREAQKARKEVVLEKQFTERDGVPNSWIVTAQDAPRSFAISPTLAGRNAVFEGGVTLLGGAVTHNSATREVAVTLQWQTQKDGLADDTVLIHIVNQNTGEVVAEGDTQPVYGNYKMPRWQNGEVVLDPHWVTLPALAPGIYQARIGLYDTATKNRRAIADPRQDAAGNSLMLATFEVKQP